MTPPPDDPTTCMDATNATTGKMLVDTNIPGVYYGIMKSNLSAAELARILKKDRATITRWIEKGIIKGAVKPVGRKEWIIPKDAYEELINTQ